MYFEGREVEEHANYVADDDLIVGETYFRLSYLDDRLLVPELIPLVFLGKDVPAEAKGKLVFQDVASYLAGGALEKPTVDPNAGYDVVLETFDPGHATVQTYEEALNTLLRTSLKRRTVGI